MFVPLIPSFLFFLLLLITSFSICLHLSDFCLVYHQSSCLSTTPVYHVLFVYWSVYPPSSSCLMSSALTNGPNKLINPRCSFICTTSQRTSRLFLRKIFVLISNNTYHVTHDIFWGSIDVLQDQVPSMWAAHLHEGKKRGWCLVDPSLYFIVHRLHCRLIHSHSYFIVILDSKAIFEVYYPNISRQGSFHGKEYFY